MPGGAMDTLSELQDDIERLRGSVDRIVVTFHWGVPYEREPSIEDRQKARFAVDCGADLVVGHHPHVIQPFEVYRGAPIFYSVGNFTFGSGNSRAEGMILAVRFMPDLTEAKVYPLYVKNRDPRVYYQAKTLHGSASHRILSQVAEVSGSFSGNMRIEDGRAVISVNRSGSRERQHRAEQMV
jgi:Bacterial capsule synthesis protein PGA_cap